MPPFFRHERRPAGPGAAAFLAGAFLVGTLVLGCSDAPPPLRIDGVAFSEEELLGVSEDRREQLVALTALGLAQARGQAELAGAPLIERRREERLVERFRAALALSRAGVGEDVLRARYRTDPEHELVVRHAVALAEEAAPDSAHRRARSTAETALERVRSGESMAEVAADLSEEPGAAERGGLLQPGRRGSWVPAFWQAASSLDEGAHTGVVRTEYGYHVIQLEERRVVPFEEVRGRAVLQAGRMLGGTDEAWTAWADSVSSELSVNRTLLPPWEDGSDAGGGGAGGDGDDGGGGGGWGGGDGGSGEPPDSAALATWPGGSYTVADFRSHLAGLEARDHRALLGGGPDRISEEVRIDALRERAQEEAISRDLGLSDAALEELVREWRDQMTAWALPLGFQAGIADAEVKDRALEALSTARQNATIARREVAGRAPLFRAAYPVHETRDP